MPNPPGANPLVAERAPYGSSQPRVTGGQQPVGNPYRFLSHFFWTPRDPGATPIVTRGEGSFSYQGVSTRGVRHSPEIHPEPPPETKIQKNTKNIQKSGVFVISSFFFCILVSGEDSGCILGCIYFGLQRGFVFCRGCRNSQLYPCKRLGVFQRPLTLILLQKYRDTNGSRIVIKIGGV